MRPAAGIIFLVVASARLLLAQDPAAAPEQRGWMSRMLHPFHSERLPDYKDPRLRGLVLDLELSPQPVKLSEVRQLEVHMTMTNKSKRPITLDFATEERIEIFLRNAAEIVLTKYSDNHSYENVAGSVLINPQEHVNYDATIATRELTPNKVFICEVFFPEYPELRVRQKFMTAP
ncbi:MAG: BsuPI-related putative proteinase inhibitor [Chthoniobacterales bacterium]